MPVTVEPRSTDTHDDRDLAQRVADLEALIEEAHRRARRRRRLYAAAVLAAAGAVAAGLAGTGGGSHPSLGNQAAEGARLSASAQSARERWAPTGGPDGGAGTLAVDPTNPAILYAGGAGNVFKSTDGGGTWKPATTAGDGWSSVSALVVDPTQHRVVYAATNQGVGKTVDGGRHWFVETKGLYGYQPPPAGDFAGVGSLVIDNHHPQTLYVTKDGALFRTTDGGGHWRTLAPAPYRLRRCVPCSARRFAYYVTAAIDPNDAQTIYASWNGRTAPNLYKSTDRGDSWQRITTHGLTLSSFGSLAVDAGTLYSAGGSQAGVAKSSDGGVTWGAAGLSGQTVWSLEVNSGALYANTEAGLFRTSDAGATWQPLGRGANAPDGVVVTDPRNANTVYGIGSDGVVKSLDGGRTWAEADKGVVSTSIPSLALAPGSANVLYAGSYGKIFKSTDGGRTWQAERGLGTSDIDTLAFDPANSHILYAAASWNGGLFKSIDAGAHWYRVRTPFPSKGVHALAIDPGDSRTIYVADCGGACSGGTLQKTVNGGSTWQAVTGVPYAVQTIAIDPQHTSTVFAGTTRGDVFRSTDAGRTWRQVAVPPTLPQSHQYAIVAFAIDHDTVYAGRRTGGVIKSADGGATWRRANTGLSPRHINALALDPRNPRVLYVSAGNLVLRSTDGAATWHLLNAGVPAVGVSAFAIGGGKVFAATNGDGVIRLSAK